ncbi:MAG: hypothetical protein QS721_12415 [Candidatus Endonucleobacter sp. (ex Gigantidas childressi)]|nr:hypothetical protein [Candidatus Endonucleobacter sp. (ex Gigantidas childressi)]
MNNYFCRTSSLMLSNAKAFWGTLVTIDVVRLLVAFTDIIHLRPLVSSDFARLSPIFPFKCGGCEFDCYSISFYCKHLISVFALLTLICSFNVIAYQNHTSQADQLHQEIIDQPTKQNWFCRQFDRATSLIGRCFDKANLSEGSECGRSKGHSIRHLQHMLDGNDLYRKLEAFKEKPVFEVLAMVYVYILLEVDGLEQDIIAAGLEPPCWLGDFSDITQEIKKKVGGCLPKSKETQFTLSTEKEQRAAEKWLNARANQCFSMLQTLLQYQVNTNKTSSLVHVKLNEQVSLLMSMAKNNTAFFNEVILKSPYDVVHILLSHYVVMTTSVQPVAPEFPVLEALVSWAMSNADSKISKLLADSKAWSETQHSTVIEGFQKSGVSESDQVFFCYLNNRLTTKRCNAEQYLFDLETEEIAAEILGRDIIKSVIYEFKTVKQLAAVCQKGHDSLSAMHSNREQQETLSPYGKIKKQKEEFNQEDMDEYLQQGIKENIKNSVFGKIASSLSYAFNAIKSNFIATPTKEEKSTRVMVDWVRFVQKNASKLKNGDKDGGVKLVMRELVKLDIQHAGGISISDALVALVKQRLDTGTQGDAFALIAGLECKLNEKQKECFSNSATPYSEYVDQNVNNEYVNAKDELGASERDGVLHDPDFAQQGCNIDSLAEQCDQSYLHQDWCFIKEEDEGSDKDLCGESRTFYLGSSKGLWSMFGTLITIALPVFFIANVIPGNYAYSEPSSMSGYNATGVIDITNSKELSMIGNNVMYPSFGNYRFINSFNASNFTTPIMSFSGKINGNNHTICDLPICLIQTIEGNGTVQNLTIRNANITSKDCSAVVAEVIKDNALVRLVDIKNSYFYVQYDGSIATPEMGVVAEKMTGSSIIERITLIDTNIIYAISRNISSENIFTVGGVVGVMADYSKMSDIAAINTSICTEGKAHNYIAKVGGAVGSIQDSAVMKNIVFIDTYIKVGEGRLWLGGVVGELVDYTGSISNTVSINTSLIVENPGSSCIALGVGMVRVGEANMHHNLVINGTIKVVTDLQTAIDNIMVDVGAAVGSYGSQGNITMLRSIDNIIINSKIERISLGNYSHSVVGSCAGAADEIFKSFCSIADNIDVLAISSKTKADTAQSYGYESGTTLMNSYKKTSNVVDQCKWVRLFFINDECNLGEDKLDIFKERVRDVNLYSVFEDSVKSSSTVKTASSKTAILVAAIGSGSTIAVAVISGGCYCNKKSKSNSNGNSSGNGNRAERVDCSLNCCSLNCNYSSVREVTSTDEVVTLDTGATENIILIDVVKKGDAKESDHMLGQ